MLERLQSDVLTAVGGLSSLSAVPPLLGVYTCSKRIRFWIKIQRPPPKPKDPPPEYVYNCSDCESGFNSMLEFNYHKTKCIQKIKRFKSFKKSSKKYHELKKIITLGLDPVKKIMDPQNLKQE